MKDLTKEIDLIEFEIRSLKRKLRRKSKDFVRAGMESDLTLFQSILSIVKEKQQNKE